MSNTPVKRSVWSNVMYGVAHITEVVVAQVAEQWHSVWAGRVQILGQTLAFFKFRIAVNLFSLGVQLFLITCNRTVHTLPSSFLFPIIIFHCKIYQL